MRCSCRIDKTTKEHFPHWERRPSSKKEALMVVDLPTELAYFCMEDIFSYAIIDTGATRSMAGLSHIAWTQDKVFEEMGAGPLELDSSVVTTFTYANGPRFCSLGNEGIPHPLALASQHGCLWFMMVETLSFALLGLDYLDAAGASCNPEGVLEYTDGHL